MPAFAHSLSQLSSAQKSARGVSLYSRHVNRPLGRVFAAAAHVAGMTPNQVTGLSALFSFAGIAVLATAPPSATAGVAVWLLLVLGFALDSADGQLARLRGGGSAGGEWLDHVVDCVKIVCIHLAVLISFYRHADPATGRLLLLPLGYLLVSVVMFFGGTLTDQLLRQARIRAPAAGPPPAPPSPARSVALLPADYGVFCLLFLFLGTGDLFVGLYAALLAVTAILTAALLVHWFGQLRRLG